MLTISKDLGADVTRSNKAFTGAISGATTVASTSGISPTTLE